MFLMDVEEEDEDDDEEEESGQSMCSAPITDFSQLCARLMFSTWKGLILWNPWKQGLKHKEYGLLRNYFELELLVDLDLLPVQNVSDIDYGTSLFQFNLKISHFKALIHHLKF